MTIIVPHDPAWRADFEQEAERLRTVLGSACVRVEHIGSTAIPGLAAKPVIDLLLTLVSLDAADEKADALRKAGYDVRGENGLPGRRYYCRYSTDGRHTHHVHAYAEGSADLHRHRAFRDYLRAHPQACADYAALKQALALAPGADRKSYQAGKQAMVSRLESQALRWMKGRAMGDGACADLHAEKLRNTSKRRE